MSIELPPELEEIVQEKVSSGKYANAVEFLREAILLAVAEENRKRKRLNEAVTVGMQQADRGEFSARTVQDIIADKEAEKNG